MVYDCHLEKPHGNKIRTINFGDYSLKYDIKSVTSTVTIPTKMWITSNIGTTTTDLYDKHFYHCVNIIIIIY